MCPIKFVVLPVEKQRLTIQLALFLCGLGWVIFFHVLYPCKFSFNSFIQLLRHAFFFPLKHQVLIVRNNNSGVGGSAGENFRCTLCQGREPGSRSGAAGSLGLALGVEIGWDLLKTF